MSGGHEKLTICMRDSGYEFLYEGNKYYAKEGKVGLIANENADLKVTEEKPEYVLCAVVQFTLFGPKVALIKKNRPEWQKGRFNMPGGHVEHGENKFDAASREFYEETGVKIHDWYSLDFMKEYNVHVLCAEGEVEKCRTMTDEFVVVEYVTALGGMESQLVAPNVISYAIAAVEKIHAIKANRE